MRKKGGFILMIAFLCSATSCGKNGNFTAYDYQVSAVQVSGGMYVSPLNTSVNIRMFDDSEPIRNAIFDVYEASIHHSHRLFDRHNYYIEGTTTIQNLKVINDSYASGNLITIEDDLFNLLQLSIDMSEQTNGYFNPTMGELLDLWQYDGDGESRYTAYGGEREDPDYAAVAAKQSCVVPSSELRNVLELDAVHSTVRFNQYNACSSVKLSLGAIAKGFALDIAKEALKQQFPDVPLILDGGSSSIITIGINPTPTSKNRPKKYAGKWLVGMISANVPYLTLDRNAYVVATLAFAGDHSFSTSGDFEQYYFATNSIPEGIKRHHIINPKTGYSETIWRMLSLYGQGSSAVLDGLSTALFNVSDTAEIMTIIQAVNSHFEMECGVFIEQDSEIAGKLKLYASNYFYNGLDLTTLKTSLLSSSEITLID